MPALDIDVLYAHLKPSDWLKSAAGGVVSRVENGEMAAYTSAISVVELELVSRRDFDRRFSQQVLGRLRAIRGLELRDLTEAVLETAASVRSRADLGIFDAIHAATALKGDRAIVSTDAAFDRVVGLKRVDPRGLP
ncbi:MAG: type II toxin-antitoxin system VapC family toxin [Halobacteria archaeon]